MPKLETTIDNLQLKSNLVTSGTVPLSTWTDTQYPSAKTLYDTYNNMLNLMHPIGSVYTTVTNNDPAEIFGGTWELIDKEFKAQWLTVGDTQWTAEEATLYSYCNIALAGHNMNIRLGLKNSSELTDSDVKLGKLDVPSFGLTEFPYRLFHEVAVSDGGGGTICYHINQNGTITVNDAFNVNGTHSIASGRVFYINYVYTVHSIERMLDEFCDKFYWKRIA